MNFRLDKKLLIACLALVFFVAHTSRAQRAKTHTLTPDEAKLVKKDGATLFSSGDFNGALKAYQDLYKTDKSNPDFNYKLGYCLLMTNSIKTKAHEYLELGSKSKDVKKDIQYMLGMAYMSANRWDDAIKSFTSYKATGTTRPNKDFLEADRMIEMCNNGKEITQHPVDVTFTNPGKVINTPFEDYNPFISGDGRNLIFTSRRKGNMGGFIADLGVYSADVFSALWKDTVWAKARSVGSTVNTDWDEETIGYTNDGLGMLVYFDNADYYGDLGISMLKGKTCQRPLMFGPTVNSKALEGGASMTIDGSTIYFSSERKDGLGGSDIWTCKRLPNNEWGPATNLGNTINTKYNEDGPFISIDGKTLYFSSKGHSSMGGFDIFYSSLDIVSGVWNKPTNIGSPLNSTDDNIFFSMTANGRTAYVSAVRQEGLGDKDIYKVTFNDEKQHPFLTVISGAVISSAGSNRVEVTKVSLLTKDKKEVMVYKPNAVGNQYILAAKPGDYIIAVEGFGFPPKEEEITVENISPPKNMVKNFTVVVSK